MATNPKLVAKTAPQALNKYFSDATVFVCLQLEASCLHFLFIVVFGSCFAYNLSYLLTIQAFLLTVELLCLQWESTSKKHLNGLQAKKLNCK